MFPLLVPYFMWLHMASNIPLAVVICLASNTYNVKLNSIKIVRLLEWKMLSFIIQLSFKILVLIHICTRNLFHWIRPIQRGAFRQAVLAPYVSSLDVSSYVPVFSMEATTSSSRLWYDWELILKIGSDWLRRQWGFI